MSTGLTNFASVMTQLVSIIEGNTVLMTMFCGGLLSIAAYVFKRIKNAVR